MGLSPRRALLRFVTLSTFVFVLSYATVFVRGQSQPLTPKLYRVESAIPNRYIVVLSDVAAGSRGNLSMASALASDLAATHGGNVQQVYKHALNGFAVQMTAAAAAAMSQDPRVLFVEEDAEVHAIATQISPTWGLDRIDQRDRPIDGQYTYAMDGSGVNVYIIDSGMRFTHADFQGRALRGADFVGDGQNGVDCMGHGTHVAGTVGGATYGVAKRARLYAVRVFGCADGALWSTIIAAVDWVTANAIKPAVVNMSLGGPAEVSIDMAVRNSIASGVTYAIAAGNDYGLDASFKSPARVAEAITVGASDVNDVRAFFSNVGTVLDVFAPGQSVTSAWYTSDTAEAILSGTSMAAPHVAGVAALYLQRYPSATPATVGQAIATNATPGRVTDPGPGSPNLLLYSGFITAPPTHFTLTLNRSGAGSGTVTSTPSGINCGAQCQANFAVSAEVSLTAQASAGSVFASWSGCDAVSGTTCRITMSANRTVTARFNPITFVLTVVKAGTGGGGVTSSPAGINCGSNCAANFTKDTVVTLSATPASDSRFVGWSGGTCTGTDVCRVTMTAASSVTATFEALPPPQFTLTVRTIGTGTGDVTSSPAGIDCGGLCSARYDRGTLVTLAAQPTADSTFTGWDGDSGCGDGSVTIRADMTCTAAFELLTPPISFAPPRKIHTAPPPDALVSGDLNGDGALDLLLIKRNDKHGTVLLGNGSGEFEPWAAVRFFRGASAIALGDLNGDHVLDLAVTSDHDLEILLGNGRGEFGSRYLYRVGRQPRAVALGDLNADQILDVVVANSESRTVSVLFGDGDGTFGTAAYYDVGSHPFAVALGDLDRNGTLDLAVANYGDDTVSVLFNDGMRRVPGREDEIDFRPVTIATGDQPRDLLILDANADGALDLAVANEGSRTISLVFGNGFGSGAQLQVDKPFALAMGDFNLDGRADLVATNPAQNTVSILLDKGRGVFGWPFRFAAGNTPRAIAVGDFDLDGRPDLVVTSSRNQVTLLLNTTPWP